MKRRVNKKKLVILIIVPIGVLMSTYFISRGLTYSTDTMDRITIFKGNDNSVEEGIRSIKELESASILEIQKEIDNVKSKNDNKFSDYENGKIGYNVLFENSVIMGDSRAEGLTEYDILNNSSVVAYKGRTTLEAMDDISTVVGLTPSNVIMTYGMNDLTIYDNPGDFIKSYEKLIRNIQKKLPDSKIYVTSILPVQPNAISKNSKFNNLEMFNLELKNMCSKLGIKFIDTGSLDSKYYESDGIHFKFSAYSIWLNSIAKEADL